MGIIVATYSPVVLTRTCTDGDELQTALENHTLLQPHMVLKHVPNSLDALVQRYVCVDIVVITRIFPSLADPGGVL